jgi:outer membrane protein
MNKCPIRFTAFILTIIMLGSSGIWTGGPAWATTTQNQSDQATQRQLTLEEAISRAVKHSYALKLANYNVEQSEIKREEAADEVNYTPSSGGNDEASRAFINLVQEDINLQVSKKNLSIEQDKIAYEVYQKYSNVLSAQQNYETAELSLEYSKYQRLAAQMKYTVGKLSRQSLESAIIDYNNQESNLAQARSSLEQSYLQLNELLGLSGQERPVLVDGFTWEPMQISDLDVEISRRLSSSPTLWNAEKSVELAELSLTLYTFAGQTGGDNYNYRNIDVNKAKLSAAQKRDQLQQSMRDIYTSICDLEEQYNNLQQDLKLAESEYQGLQLKYKLGLIPKGDLLAAELELANHRKSINDVIYQHQLLIMTFDKPWVKQ